jgi:hypothetical protein
MSSTAFIPATNGWIRIVIKISRRSIPDRNKATQKKLLRTTDVDVFGSNAVYPRTEIIMPRVGMMVGRSHPRAFWVSDPKLFSRNCTTTIRKIKHPRVSQSTARRLRTASSENIFSLLRAGVAMLTAIFPVRTSVLNMRGIHLGGGPSSFT